MSPEDRAYEPADARADPGLHHAIYFVFGRSPIQRSIRVALTAGGMANHILFAVLSIVIGDS